MSKKKTGLTFKPHAFKPNSAGDGLVIDHDNSNPYILLQSHTQGKLYYTPKENKYWIAEGKEVSEERFASVYLPYLHWAYDQIVIKDGKKVNEFPPTPANIQAKRRELMEKAFAENRLITEKELFATTCPVELKNTDEFEALLNQKSPDMKLIERLNRSGM